MCTYSRRHAHTLTRATVETAAAPPHHQPQGTTKDHIGDQPQPGRDTISLSVLHGTWEQTQLLRSRQAGLRRGELSLIQKDESVLNLSGNSLQPHLGSCLVTHSRDTLGVRHLQGDKTAQSVLQGMVAFPEHLRFPRAWTHLRNCMVHAKCPEQRQTSTWQKLRHLDAAPPQHLGDTTCWVWWEKKGRGCRDPA